MLKKQRLIVTLNLIILSLFACMYSMVSQQNNTVLTVALPVSNKVIVLDAGHGLPDEGAFLLHKENKQLTFYK
jgi:N-acetylmuramoyl-L-alanine amidase